MAQRVGGFRRKTRSKLKKSKKDKILFVEIEEELDRLLPEAKSGSRKGLGGILQRGDPFVAMYA